MSAQVIDSYVNIIDSKGDDREPGGDWIERRKRSALQNDEIDAT